MNTETLEETLLAHATQMLELSTKALSNYSRTAGPPSHEVRFLLDTQRICFTYLDQRAKARTRQEKKHA